MVVILPAEATPAEASAIVAVTTNRKRNAVDLKRNLLLEAIGG
jgi:hypothetical protein